MPRLGLSIAGQRNVHDPRNSLAFEFARLCIEIQPKTFVMENVPGITSMRTPEGIPVLDALALYLSDGGMGTYIALRQALAGIEATAVARPIRAAQPECNTAADPAEPDWALALFELPTRQQSTGPTTRSNPARVPRRRKRTTPPPSVYHW
ncbi:MAG: DNA cytosine methyltransferase [Actinobacteria bacterium]|nr:DNA cytosine methyltransferase [Actinomycetota bacterium]